MDGESDKEEQEVGTYISFASWIKRSLLNVNLSAGIGSTRRFVATKVLPKPTSFKLKLYRKIESMR